jgi:hypothetical protein
MFFQVADVVIHRIIDGLAKRGEPFDGVEGTHPVDRIEGPLGTVGDDFGVPIFRGLLCILFTFEPELFAKTVDEANDAPFTVGRAVFVFVRFANFEKGWTGSGHTFRYTK